MLTVGITGGIGSGKTTVCKMFESLGIPVYYADDRAKYLMQHESGLVSGIRKEFGEDVYDNGVLNRPLLAQKVFNDSQKLATLNALVHPAVFHDVALWIAQQRQNHVPYCLKEAALLIESGSYKTLDKLIVVTATLPLRLQRVAQRDQTNEQEIMTRIQHQLPDEEKLKLADVVIENNSTLKNLQQQVLKIHRQYTLLGNKSK